VILRDSIVLFFLLGIEPKKTLEEVTFTYLSYIAPADRARCRNEEKSYSLFNDRNASVVQKELKSYSNIRFAHYFLYEYLLGKTIGKKDIKKQIMAMVYRENDIKYCKTT
jgi:hypothetical protein